MVELPRGTVAFLFTDVEGSTRLWQQHQLAMERADARHDAILRGAVAEQGGVVYKVVGDAVQAAFPTVEQAVAAALEVQLGLSLQGWAGLGLPEPLRVRTALHAAAVVPRPCPQPMATRGPCALPHDPGRLCAAAPRHRLALGRRYPV